MKPSAVTMAYGLAIFLSTLIGWLYGESRGIDTTMLWAITTPLVLALFVGQGISEVADAARQAATQTNGTMDGRIKAAVSAALADRDAARTRQAQGDISQPRPSDPAEAEDLGSRHSLT